MVRNRAMVIAVLMVAAGVGVAGGAGLKRVGGSLGGAEAKPGVIHLYDAEHPPPAIEIRPARSLFDPR